ncbi:MAG: tetratricopeptide repeat protein [Candidatus Omnitrophota bacterium]
MDKKIMLFFSASFLVFSFPAFSQLVDDSDFNIQHQYIGKSQKETDALKKVHNGMEYLSKGKYDDAIVEFNKAIEINSNCAEAYCKKGIAYVKKGNRQEAAYNLKKALIIAPHYSEALSALSDMGYVEGLKSDISSGNK